MTMTTQIHAFSFPAGAETISAAVYTQRNFIPRPEFIFLHGAGIGRKERILDLAEPLIRRGHDLLAFDFSGHGASTGELKKGSLERRVNEATETILRYGALPPRALTICGSSMGGYVALKILQTHSVDKLILFCPALYDRAAYRVRFDQGFSEIIRQSESWLNTDVLESLRNFRGKLLIVMGDQDKVIPPGVIDLILRTAQNAQQKEIHSIPGCPHQINIWLASRPEEQVRLAEKLLTFLR